MGINRMNLLNQTGAVRFAEEPGQDGGSSEPKSAEGADSNGNPKPADDQDDEKLGEGGIKALRAERKSAADAKKRVEELEARLKEIDDADKSELQKAQERIAELEKTTQAYETEKKRTELRASVLATKNVPSEWADFVTGDTEDEMTKSADRILANLARADEGPDLHGTRGNPGGSLEAGREAAKNFRP